jgi:hypothetical protein
MTRASISTQVLAAALLFLLGCTASQRVGSDCPEEGPCIESAITDDEGELPSAPTRGGEIDKVDILFVVDDSGSMKEEQDLFAAQLPRLLSTLRSGDSDGAGNPEFRGVSDVHVGVVSTDMGLPGIEGIEKCQELGDDAKLLTGTTACLGGDARFLDTTTFTDDGAASEAMQCMARLGTDGCGFEQQLEAGLKALWPSSDDGVTFLPGVNGEGANGHGDGDGANAGFLRDDSLLIVITLTDEDDCSRIDNGILRPPAFLEAGDPLLSQGLNLRCHANPDALYDVERYVAGLKALRAYHDLVMFFAIAGMPPESVNDSTVAGYSFEDRSEREAFYDALLAHPMMQPTSDTQGTESPDDDTLVPVCDTPIGRAYPAQRLVQVARDFGVNGMVQSICEPDFSGPMSTILRSIGRRLGPPEI